MPRRLALGCCAIVAGRARAIDLRVIHLRGRLEARRAVTQLAGRRAGNVASRFSYCDGSVVARRASADDLSVINH